MNGEDVQGAVAVEVDETRARKARSNLGALGSLERDGEENSNGKRQGSHGERPPAAEQDWDGIPDAAGTPPRLTIFPVTSQSDKRPRHPEPPGVRRTSRLARRGFPNAE
ncbi:MAG: hypothetical protein L0206_19310, partial [Actinobacteria bacterium]|nr:hypothetical protein [Actinomycetota bacterium]